MKRLLQRQNSKPSRRDSLRSTRLKKNYFSRLIDSNDPASVKRFLGLVCSAFLIFSSFVLLLVRYRIPNQELVDKVLLYNMLIVVTSLLGMSVETIGKILLEGTKAKAAATIVNGGDMPPTPVGPPGGEDGDEVVTARKAMKEIRRETIKSLKPNKNVTRKL